MSRILPALLATLVLLAVPLSPVAAAPSDQLQLDRVQLEDYPTVRATVTAPQALVGQELPPEAFTVVEAGRQRPVEVSQLPNDNLEVVLLVDTSGSMRPAMASAQQAAGDFVAALPAGVRLAVVGFGSETAVAQPFTEDKGAVEAALSGLQPEGETALYDGVDTALDEFGDGGSTRRSVVLLSDGADTASSNSLRTVARRLDRSGATLYALRLSTGDSDEKPLQRLAAAAGGSVVAVDDPGALGAVYDEVASQLVNQYVVEYQSQASGRTEVVFSLVSDDVTETATRMLDLPAAPRGPGDAPRLEVVSVDTSDHPEVRIRVVVPQELAGQDLSPGDFTVVEGGRARDIEASRIEPVDLEIVLAIDTSGSMSGAPLQAAKAAARRFIESAPAGARIALVTFADTPHVLIPFTDDSTSLLAAVDKVEAGGETALHDAGRLVARMFQDRDDAARSVVLLSDGGDTVSAASLEEAAQALADGEVTVYAVQLDSPEADPSALRTFTERTHGKVIAAGDAASLTAAYEQLAADVANQYLLGYRSGGHGTSELEVLVDAEGVHAKDVETIELPPLPRLQALLGSRLGLLLGAILCYVAMALIILLLLVPQRRQAIIAGAASRASDGRTGLAELAARAALLAEAGLQRRGWSAGLNTALERAGINLRPGEFVVLVACAQMAVLALGVLLSGLPLGLVLATVAVIAARFGLRILGDRRRDKFADQLGETLQLLAGSLRAGYGLMQAIDSVAREADRPTSDEFRRLLIETRLGRDMHDALNAMSARVGSEDFEWVVQAIEIHREVGGDLADVLDNVAATIRERNQIRRQIKALSAEGRLSAYVLLALPFGLAGVIFMTNPGYLAILFTSGLMGWSMVFGGLVFMIIGAVWLRKVCRLVF